MKFKFLLAIYFVICATQSFAALQRIERFKLPGNNEVYEGYRQGDSVYLYKFNGSDMPTRFDKDDVVMPESDNFAGVSAGGKVLWKNQYGHFVTCDVEAVFQDGAAKIFCDELVQVGKSKNYFKNVRSHVVLDVGQVVPETRQHGNFTKGSLYVVQKSTRLFARGSTVRLLRVYPNGYAEIQSRIAIGGERSHLARVEFISLHNLQR